MIGITQPSIIHREDGALPPPISYPVKEVNMLTIRYRYLLLLLLLLLPLCLHAQESVLRLAPYNGTPASFINTQIGADTLAGGVIPANRVYVLQRGAPYLANAVFNVSAGQTLRLRANDSAGVRRPVIFLYPTGTGANPQRPPGNFAVLRGNLEMKSIVLSGYFEPIDTNLNNLQGALLNIPTAGAGASITLDSCILTNSNGNHVRTDGAVNLLIVKNCIFANMGYLGTSNLGAGKAFDLRDASADTVIVQNNTFVNWQDRIIRHYNFSNPLAGTGAINYLKFDHNTLANGMSFHGLLSLGSMGPKAVITNNLMIDPYSLGNDTDATRQAEFVNNLEHDQYGGPRMAWIFTTPNDTTQWTISNNYYVISDSGQAFYNSYGPAGVTGEGSPLTYHINSKLGGDSVNAFKKISLALSNIPMLMTAENRWYRSPTGGNKTKNTPNAALWNRSFDYDRKGWAYYHDTLNCTYSTSSTAYTGATGSYPAGDLNWFPSKKVQWLGDPAMSVTPAGEPLAFSLSQNYPNPFNPSTRIEFSLRKETKVKLEVFDLLGRNVATLVDGPQHAGQHFAEFNASQLASGFYIYRLSSPELTVAKKMMLVK